MEGSVSSDSVPGKRETRELCDSSISIVVVTDELDRGDTAQGTEED
jgi:hypothetical protein